MLKYLAITACLLIPVSAYAQCPSCNQPAVAQAPAQQVIVYHGIRPVRGLVVRAGRPVRGVLRGVAKIRPLKAIAKVRPLKALAKARPLRAIAKLRPLRRIANLRPLRRIVQARPLRSVASRIHNRRFRPLRGLFRR